MDGSLIVMGGVMWLMFDCDDLCVVMLEWGEVMFVVWYDDSDLFEVNVGGVWLVDVGIVFDVKYVCGEMCVVVLEGVVDYNLGCEGIWFVKG